MTSSHAVKRRVWSHKKHRRVVYLYPSVSASLSLYVCVCVCVCVCQLMANHSTTLVARSRLIDLPVTLAAFVIHIRSVGSTAFSSRRVHTDARPMMLCAKGTGWLCTNRRLNEISAYFISVHKVFEFCQETDVLSRSQVDNIIAFLAVSKMELKNRSCQYEKY